MALGEFRENLSDITGVDDADMRGLRLQASNQGNDGLTDKFAATDGANSPLHDDSDVNAVHDREAAQVREDLSRERIEAMSGIDTKTRMERGAGSRRESAQDNLRRRAKQQFNDQIFFIMLQQNIDALQAQVAGIEDGLRARYGENFAEVIAAKYLDEKTAQRLPGESDEEYWDRIALEIQRGIEAGEIDPDDPLVKEWADKRTELKQAEDKRRAHIAENAEELAANGKLRKQKSTDLIQAEDKTAATAKGAVQDTFVNTTRDIGQDSGAASGLSALAEIVDNGSSITTPTQTNAPSEMLTPETPKMG